MFSRCCACACASSHWVARVSNAAALFAATSAGASSANARGLRWRATATASSCAAASASPSGCNKGVTKRSAPIATAPATAAAATGASAVPLATSGHHHVVSGSYPSERVRTALADARVKRFCVRDCCRTPCTQAVDAVVPATCSRALGNGLVPLMTTHTARSPTPWSATVNRAMSDKGKVPTRMERRSTQCVYRSRPGSATRFCQCSAARNVAAPTQPIARPFHEEAEQVKSRAGKHRSSSAAATTPASTNIDSSVADA